MQLRGLGQIHPHPGPLSSEHRMREGESSAGRPISRIQLVFRSKGFWPPARRERRAYPSEVCKERATTREAKRAAARRVAPKMAWGFVAPQSQIATDMLLRRASPQAILGATQHQLYARHHTSDGSGC